MKILVVNRQQEVIGKILSLLPTEKIRASYYDSGYDGLMAGRAEQFDLILVEAELPVITGYEMVRSLRHSSVNKHTPVVFTAEELSGKVRYLGNLLGAIAILTETDSQGLEEIVKNQLKKYEAKRASEWQDFFQNQQLN